MLSAFCPEAILCTLGAVRHLHYEHHFQSHWWSDKAHVAQMKPVRCLGERCEKVIIAEDGRVVQNGQSGMFLWSFRCVVFSKISFHNEYEGLWLSMVELPTCSFQRFVCKRVRVDERLNARQASRTSHYGESCFSGVFRTPSYYKVILESHQQDSIETLQDIRALAMPLMRFSARFRSETVCCSSI